MGQNQKAALYIRVSTADQAMHGYSLEAQQRLLEEYATAHGMEVVGVYADEGKSASKSLDKRTELLRLLNDAKLGKFAVVLFKDITRWSRNAAAYYKVQEILDAAHVGWVAVEQPYLETMTPTGRFQVSVMLGTAQLEAEQTGQRIKFVQEAEIKRGHYPFPPHCAPTGYTTEKRDDGNHLVIDEQTAPVIRTIFSTFRKTYNLQRCVEQVREKHGIEYAETTVNRILRNPIYKGEFRGLPGFCEPIVEPSLFDMLQRPKRVYTASKHRGEYIFSGLVRCAHCGKTMRGLCPDDRYHMYQCRSGCHVTVTQRKLERYVLSMIEPELTAYRVIVKQRKKDNKAVEQERKKCQEKLRRLVDLYTDSMIDRPEYDKRRREIEDRMASLEPAPDLPEIHTNFKEMYEKLTPEKKNVFWKAFVDHIEVSRDRVITLAIHNAKVLAERMAKFDAGELGKE
jgi:DNA invertase Pin-like site-specific DNA recombinase